MKVYSKKQVGCNQSPVIGNCRVFISKIMNVWIKLSMINL